MKTKLIVALTAFVLVFAACKKEEDDTDTGENPSVEDYQPTTAGSTWQYNSTSSGGIYTETAVAGDTTINGETYSKFDNSEGSRRYINKNGSVYKTYSRIAAIDQNLTLTYLKDVAVGTSWEDPQSFTYNSLTIPVIFKYTIASRDGDKVVNNTTYKNVIAVNVTVTANSILTGNLTVATGQQFYAKGVGSILSTLNFDALGTVVSDSTYLISADIKK